MDHSVGNINPPAHTHRLPFSTSHWAWRSSCLPCALSSFRRVPFLISLIPLPPVSAFQRNLQTRDFNCWQDVRWIGYGWRKTSPVVFSALYDFFPDFLKTLSEGYKNRDESPFYLPSAPSIPPLYSIKEQQCHHTISDSSEKMYSPPDAFNT